jgi:gamma-glutamyltranspeptidase/glutathione hydrolase
MAGVTRVAVAAPNVAAAASGARVAADGGGAVDAAVAAALVTMVNEPGIVSLSGGAFVTVWPAGAADAVTVDGCVAMPGLDGPASSTVDARDVRTGYGGGVTMTVGLASVAVPGCLAALDLAQDRYGALPWREVVEPAVETARDGFVLGTAAGYYLPLVRDDVFGWDPETRRALQQADGSWLVPGDRMVIDGLAATLRLVADEGGRTLRDGALAAAVAADMAARGGLVSRSDLAAYRPVVRDALPVRTGLWDLRTNPPPAIGGPVLAAMLVLLGDRPRGPWTEDDVAYLVAVQRRVLDVRRERLDVAEDRTAAALALLDEVGWDPPSVASPSTAHVSAVDAEGTACAITTSYGYGSGATVPGTGLWLNNCLGERELNRSAGVAPGERLPSNMAPTVGRRDDGAVLALGSPGADRITTALLQVLASVAHGGAGLQEAVDRPRLHVHHLDDGEQDVDGSGAPIQVEAEADLPLPWLDLPVRRHDPRSMYFGGVGAALRLPDGGLEAAGDPRRVGAVVVSPGPS